MPLTLLTRLGMIVVATMLSTAAALAQDVPWPRCSDRLDGQQLCGNGSVCECHYDSGGTLTGRVAAWRWSCDLLKMCGDPVPAGADPQPLPPGFSYAPSGQQPNDPANPDPAYPPYFEQRGGRGRR